MAASARTIDGRPFPFRRPLCGTHSTRVTSQWKSRVSSQQKLTFATNEIVGFAAGATLTNVADTIKGAGQIGAGSLILVNDAAGVIDGSATSALTIDTGTSTIANAGLIENTAAGGVLIKSAISNTGTLMVTTGTLTVNGADPRRALPEHPRGSCPGCPSCTAGREATDTGVRAEILASLPRAGSISPRRPAAPSRRGGRRPWPRSTTAGGSSSSVRSPRAGI